MLLTNQKTINYEKFITEIRLMTTSFLRVQRYIDFK